MGSITLNDLNDAIVSGTAPTNPEVGQLWLNDNVLKQYTNGKWEIVTLDILKMDEILDITIKGIEATLGNISADGKLSFIDRKVVAQNMGEVIGEMPSTSTSSMTVLPDYTVLDSKGVGTFAFLRATALSVGITKDDTVYKELELTYNNLSSYLASTNPKMWDITDANEEKVITLSNADDFNGYFLNYYLAEAGMSAEIDKRANELMLKITEGSKSGVVVKDVEGTELYTTEGDLNGALDIVVEGNTDNLTPLEEGRNLFSYKNNILVKEGESGSLTRHKDAPNGYYMVGNREDTDDIRLYDVLDGNGFYTISFELRGTQNGSGSITLEVNEKAPITVGNVIKTTPDNDYHRVYKTFEVTDFKGDGTDYISFNPSWAYIYIKDIYVYKGKDERAYKPAPEDLTIPNLVSANNFNLVSQMGKFKSMSAREDTEEITNIWNNSSTTTEVLNEPYTSERYPYLNLRKVGFKDISAIYRNGGETSGEGVRGGIYTYVLYLKPLVSSFLANHNGLEKLRGIMYKDGVRSTYTSNQPLTKGSEYLLIATFTHRTNYDFWQYHLSHHETTNTEFVMSNFMLFEGDVVEEIESSLPGVGTVLNPDSVTGTPDWANTSTSYVSLPQPLRSAGDGVSDRLRRNESGKWEVLRRVNELELQNALDLLSEDTGDRIKLQLYGYNGDSALEVDNATEYVKGLKSSHFIYNGNPVLPNSPDWHIGMNGAKGERAHNLLFKPPVEYATLQAFKDFVTAEAEKGNPIRVVYELREPFVEELPDEVQITLDKVYTYPHSNSVYTVFPELDKTYNHPHPYLKANFLGGAEGTRRRTQADLDDKANQEDVDSVNDAIVTINATTENLGDSLVNTVTALETLDGKVSGLETNLTQTEKGWEFNFSNFNTSLSDLEEETTEGFSRINKHIRFEDGKIILGTEGSNTFLEITPDRITFNNGGAVVAYITNQTMEITHGIFVQTATIAGMRIQRVPGSNNIGFTVI